MHTLNELYSRLSTRRRYEVWFIRLGLADGSGAWWFRYLLLNPGRRGCAGKAEGLPLQVWATWFPRNGKPQSFIQGFSLDDVAISGRGESRFHLRTGKNGLEENSCHGALQVDGHVISWDLHYRSTFRVTLSSKGWIGFSRTPHSDAFFSGKISLDGRSFEGDPLGFGVQGHNCGYRHRNFWSWTHVIFPQSDRPSTTFEALVYEMPFGLLFRKAVLWHEGQSYEFRGLREIRRDARELVWHFGCVANDGLQIEAIIDGSGSSIHRLPYLKTDCKSSFEVANNSLARALLRVERRGRPVETLETSTGAVLEMAGP